MKWSLAPWLAFYLIGEIIFGDGFFDRDCALKDALICVCRSCIQFREKCVQLALFVQPAALLGGAFVKVFFSPVLGHKNAHFAHAHTFCGSEGVRFAEPSSPPSRGCQRTVVLARKRWSSRSEAALSSSSSTCCSRSLFDRTRDRIRSRLVLPRPPNHELMTTMHKLIAALAIQLDIAYIDPPWVRDITFSVLHSTGLMWDQLD